MVLPISITTNDVTWEPLLCPATYSSEEDDRVVDTWKTSCFYPDSLRYASVNLLTDRAFLQEFVQTPHNG